jgi:hypothetical protein
MPFWEFITTPWTRKPDPPSLCQGIEQELLDFVQVFPLGAEVPPIWEHSGPGASFTPITDPELGALYRRALIEELKKYRLDRLQHFVTRVWLVDSLRVSDVAATGTQGGTEVWIAIGSISEWDIRTTLHHEIAGQIYDIVQHRFPNEEWRAVSPDGYRDMHPADAVKAGHGSTALDLELTESGFLYEYAKSDVMKDFSSIHEFRMMAPLKMCYLANKHDKLGRKLAIWKTFVDGVHLLADGH